MKKRVSLLCATAMLVSSLAFFGCQGATNGNSSSIDARSAGTGEIVGVVLDNRGEPVEGALVTLGNKSVKTNAGGEFVITDVNVNVISATTKTITTTNGGNPVTTTGTTPEMKDTAYILTAKKDGYLSATVPGIYVSYEETQEKGNAAYQKALSELSTAYGTILGTYAGKAGAEKVVVENNSQTEDVDHETTIQTDSYAYEVMQTLADSLDSLKDLFADQVFFTNFVSTFAQASLIPCDASFSGTIVLNKKTKGGSTYGDTEYKPTVKPTVRATYTKKSNNTEVGHYDFETTADENGNFKFENCLPSHVELTITIDAFQETIDSIDYLFSGESAVVVASNSTIELSKYSTTIDKNDKVAKIMLFAQNDKIWVTDTNVDSTSTGVLLKTTDALTFTFNKPMIRAEFTAAKIANLKPTEYTATWSDDKKTVTLKPVVGYWILTDAESEIEITGEAKDGSTEILGVKKTIEITTTNPAGTTTVYVNKLKAYFDTKVWVSVKTESLSDFNGGILLSDPIVLEFSKPMSEKIALTLTGTSTAYTETWNEEKTQLTLTPNSTYWKVSGAVPGNFAGTENVPNLVTIVVDKNGGSSATYHNTDFGYWKDGAIDTGKKDANNNWVADGTNDKLVVYFDKYVDVSVAKVASDTNESFTLTFSKELKSFTAKDNIVSIKSGTTEVKDYEAKLDDTNKVVTITSKDSVFKTEGKYTIILQKLEAKDGSDLIREIGKKDTEKVTGSNAYSVGDYEITTDFRFDGLWLKPVAVEVVNSLPKEAFLSRNAIIDATTDQYIKLSFNKNIYKSAITIKTGDKADAATAEAIKAKNYINGKDVYVSLADVANVKKVLVLDGLDTVIAEDNDKLKTKNDKYFDWEELTEGLEFRIYAALTLVDSSLVTKTPDVNGYKTYKAADPVADQTVTFTFDKELPADYTAEVDLYSYNEEKGKYTKSVDTEKLTWDAPTDTVIFTSDKLLPVLAKETASTGDVSVYTTHYLSLVIKNAEGTVLFSTKTAAFGTDVGTFDKAFGALIDKKDNNVWASEQEFNTVKVNVAPYAITNYSLVSEVVDVAGNKTYKAVPAVAAKTPLVFTFNALPKNATANFDLYDSNGKLIEDAKAAEISDNKITVASDLLVVDADKAAKDTGYTEYTLTLSVKDEAGNIVYSTDKSKKTQFAVVKDSYEQKIFAPKTGKEVKDSTDKNGTKTVKLYDNNKISVKVLPVTIVASSLIETTEKGVGQTKDTYKVYNPIVPGTDVTFTFSEDLADTYVFAQLWGKKSKSANNTDWLAYLDSNNGGLKVEGEKVTIKGDYFLSYSSTENTPYELYLQINKGSGDNQKALFKSARDDVSKNNEYFGNVVDTFEKDALNSNIQYVDPDFNGKAYGTLTASPIYGAHGISLDGKTINTIKVEVVKTNVVTIKEKKDSETTTSTKFAESYNSDIVLEFTHDVPGYTAVVYKNTVTDPATTAKYEDWAKTNAANIYVSAVVPADSDSNKVTLSIGENYYENNETVKVAIFDASDDKVCIIPNVTVVDKDKKTAAYTSKKADTNADDTYLKTLKAKELPITAEEIAKVGNGQSVEFGALDVKFNAKKTAQASYKIYIKDYSATTISSDDWRDITDTAAVVYKDADGIKASTIKYQDYKLHGFNKVYFNVTFAADAFGFGDKVEVAVLETLENSRTLYTKTDLVDKVAPVLTINDVNKGNPTISTFAITKEGNATDNVTLRIPDLKKLNEFEISGIGANAHASDNSTVPAVVAGNAVKADFVLKLTGNEWLATAVASVSTTHENANADEGKKKTNDKSAGKVEWTAAGVGSIAFKDTLWFKGDVITIKAKDAKGNEATYTITIKD